MKPQRLQRVWRRQCAWSRWVSSQSGQRRTPTEIKRWENRDNQRKDQVDETVLGLKKKRQKSEVIQVWKAVKKNNCTKGSREGPHPEMMITLFTLITLISKTWAKLAAKSELISSQKEFARMCLAKERQHPMQVLIMIERRLKQSQPPNRFFQNCCFINNVYSECFLKCESCLIIISEMKRFGYRFFLLLALVICEILNWISRNLITCILTKQKNYTLTLCFVAILNTWCTMNGFNWPTVFSIK